MNNQPTHQISDDELLYRTVEQLTIVTEQAKLLSEIYMVKTRQNRSEFTDDEIVQHHKLMQSIHEKTRSLSVAPILSRLVVNIAAANQSKHMLGAQLSVNKKEKTVHLKGHYGPAANDYNDLHIDAATAKLLRDGLTKAIDIIDPQPKIIIPNSLVAH